MRPTFRTPLPRFVVALTLAVGFLPVASASSPSLTAVRPMGGQRGTEVEVALSGERIGDAQEVLFYQPGITALSLEKVDDNNVKAKFKVDPDAQLGFHDLRLRTATGLSAQFLPVVKKITDRSNLSAQYNSLMGMASKSGLVPQDEATVENYVTKRALDGLYTIIAEEEKAIRKDPIGTGSAILGKVFGVLK